MQHPAKRLAVLFFLLISISPAFSQGGKLFIQQSSLSFTATSVGKSQTKVLVLRNFDQTKSIHVLISTPYTSNYSLGSSDSFTIAARGLDSLKITFTPTAAGTLVDSIYVTHDGDTSGFNAKSPTKIRLTGIGIAQGDTTPRISVGSIQAFNTRIDTFQIRTLNIRNTSDTIRLLTGAIVGLKAPFHFVSGDGSFSILTGDTAKMSIKFENPTPGTYFDTIYVQSNADAADNNLRVILVGTSSTTADVSVRPAQGLGFNATVDSVVTKLVTIKNVSKTLQKLTGAITGMLAPYAFGSGDGTFNLSIGDSVIIPVVFHPTIKGFFIDTLHIVSNADLSHNNITYLLQGQATAPVPVDSTLTASFSVRTLNFGTIKLGNSNSKAVTITNTSKVALRLSGTVVGPHLPFGIVSGEGDFQLDQNQSLTLSVNFVPSNVGNFSDSIVITTNAPDQTQSRVAVQLLGVAQNAASVRSQAASQLGLSVSPNPIRGSGMLTLGAVADGNCQVDIVNSEGEIVLPIASARLSSGNNQLPLDLSSLSAGSYFVRVSSASGIGMVKIVVTK